MNLAFEDSGIMYKPICEETLEGAIDCLTTSFCEDEPLASYLEIMPPEFKVFANVIVPPQLDNNLTFVAVDSETNKVAAIYFAEDYCQEEEAEIPGLSPKFAPIFALHEVLGEMYRTIREVKPGEVLHMFMLGVSKSYLGRGIGNKLLRHSLELATENGYKYALGEASNVISQHMLRKHLGFETLASVDYSSFTVKGEKPFDKVPLTQPSMLLMERDLSTFK